MEEIWVRHFFVLYRLRGETNYRMGDADMMYIHDSAEMACYLSVPEFLDLLQNSRKCATLVRESIPFPSPTRKKKDKDGAALRRSETEVLMAELADAIRQVRTQLFHARLLHLGQAMATQHHGNRECAQAFMRMVFDAIAVDELTATAMVTDFKSSWAITCLETRIWVNPPATRTVAPSASRLVTVAPSVTHSAVMPSSMSRLTPRTTGEAPEAIQGLLTLSHGPRKRPRTPNLDLT